MAPGEPGTEKVLKGDVISAKNKPHLSSGEGNDQIPLYGGGQRCLQLSPISLLILGQIFKFSSLWVICIFEGLSTWYRSWMERQFPKWPQ